MGAVVEKTTAMENGTMVNTFLSSVSGVELCMILTQKEDPFML